VRAPFTELENRIMSAIWSGGPSSVEAVHQAVSQGHKLKETSVRTLLRRLERKGYLRHEVEGRAFIYRAVEPARGLAARAVRQIIDRLCQGSVEELVTGMVDAKVLSSHELDQLAAFVETRVRERKGK
jgi:BlaI family penicillinase repressor